MAQTEKKAVLEMEDGKVTQWWPLEQQHLPRVTLQYTTDAPYSGDMEPWWHLEMTVGAGWDSVVAKAIVYLCSTVTTNTSNNTAGIIWDI